MIHYNWNCMKNTVAIICDCDETLAPDTTNFWLQTNRINTKDFWNRHEKYVAQGWDPPIAWMTMILQLIQDDKIKENNNESLGKLGKKIQPYKGVPEFILQLKKMISRNDSFVEFGINLEFYIISSGFEDLINGTNFSKYFKEIFGGQFAENNRGIISTIKSSVTFTEKTKFLYAINKGISKSELRKDPSRVNDSVGDEKRRIPFEHMVYLGDSPGDIPCFSAVKGQGGSSIGIMGKRTTMKGLKLARGNRTTVGPYTRNYQRGSDLRRMLETIVNKIGYEIVEKNRS